MSAAGNGCQGGCPEALAAAMDALWSWPQARLREAGAAARARVGAISWDHVIDSLTEGL